MLNKDFNDKVVLIECNDYNQKLINKKIDELLEPLGGLANFVKPGQKVVIKPNLVVSAKPEKACTTHPSIINALCGKGDFYDRTELTYFIEDGTYNKLPEVVQMAIISEVLKTKNIEVAQELLNISLKEHQTYKTRNRYIK